MPLGIQNIQSYHVVATNDDASTESYLIKVFSKKQTLVSQHEKEVLTEIPGLPSFELLGIEKHQGLNCFVFNWPVGTINIAENIGQFAFNESLMQLTLPTLFLEKYLRSHPLLPQRLNKEFWQHASNMLMLIEGVNREQIDTLLSATPNINFRLNKLPLGLINPGNRNRLIFKSASNQLLCCNWGQWSIDPIGSGWSVENNNLSHLANAISRIKLERSDIKAAEVSTINLAALMYAFERMINNQDFHQAYDLVPVLIILH